MQLQCVHCNKMFTLDQDAGLAGMYAIENDGLQHYNATCPHCQKENPISAERMREAFPNWEEDYQEMLKRAEEFEKKQAELTKIATEQKKKPKKEKKKRKRKR